MAGYIPEDLQEEFVPLNEFVPDDAVDVTRTPLKRATDLASIGKKKTPSKTTLATLEKAMEGHENAV